MKENYTNAASDASKGEGYNQSQNLTISTTNTFFKAKCFQNDTGLFNCLKTLITAIDIDAADIKALYRRCQALEKLGKLDMAFKDVQRCATLEPKNKNFLETLRRLGADIQAKVCIRNTVTNTFRRRGLILITLKLYTAQDNIFHRLKSAEHV